MIKKLIITINIFFISIYVLAIELLLDLHITKKYKNSLAQVSIKEVTIATNKKTDPQIKEQMDIEVKDARPIIVANFLKRYNSALKPYDYYGKFLVELADKYNLDFRLLPAIAMQESHLCTKIPKGSYNCLGFGIYGDKINKYSSFEENFEAAARVLSHIYIEQDKRLTPEDIEKKYTPPAKGSWASSVNQWMSEMKYDDRAKGLQYKTTQSVVEFAK